MSSLFNPSRWGISLVFAFGALGNSQNAYADIPGIAESIKMEYFLTANVSVPNPPSYPHQVLLVRIPSQNWAWAESLHLTLLDSSGLQIFEQEMYLERGRWTAILSTPARSSSTYGGRELPIVDMPFLNNSQLNATVIIHTWPALTETSLPPANLLILAAKQSGDNVLFWELENGAEVTGIAVIPEPSSMPWVSACLALLLALSYPKQKLFK